MMKPLSLMTSWRSSSDSQALRYCSRVANCTKASPREPSEFSTSRTSSTPSQLARNSLMSCSETSTDSPAKRMVRPSAPSCLGGLLSSIEMSFLRLFLAAE